MQAPPIDLTMYAPRYEIPPQVYYEQVNEGDDIPSVDFNLTVQRMIIFVGATRNYPGLHHNDRVAQKQGAAPAMFLQNNSCLMLWERVVSDWMGIYGRVRSANFRITEFHLAGDQIHVGGKVTKKWQENGLNLVELTMQSDTPRRPGMTGNVIVALPSLKYPTTTPMWDREGKATVVCQ
jgi:hypothetical protein